MRRVLAIFLDGHEQSLGQRLMSAGDMLEMSRLTAGSARFLLDYRPARRKRDGMVEIADHRRVLGEVERLVRACVDPATGESAVDHLEYPAPEDPRDLPPTQADLIVIRRAAAVCLEPPQIEGDEADGAGADAWGAETARQSAATI
jgi:hypothetical protein